jgi:hypothetical protein
MSGLTARVLVLDGVCFVKNHSEILDPEQCACLLHNGLSAVGLILIAAVDTGDRVLGRIGLGNLVIANETKTK